MSDYVPYGDKWRRGVLAMRKTDIADILKRACQENVQLRQGDNEMTLVMKNLAENKMRDAMQIAHAVKSMNYEESIVTDALSQIQDLLSGAQTLVQLAEAMDEARLAADLNYYVAQINKASWEILKAKDE